MSDFPKAADYPPVVINPFSRISIGHTWSGMSFGITSVALTWSTANQASFIPFVLAYPYMATQMFWMNGSTVGNNHVDVGIYNSEGILLVSQGSTLTSGTTALQVVNITDILLQPGKYYMAMVCDGTTDTFEGHSSINTYTNTALVAAGCFIQASAFPLPSTATFAVNTANIKTINFGITSKTVV